MSGNSKKSQTLPWGERPGIDSYTLMVKVQKCRKVC